MDIYALLGAALTSSASIIQLLYSLPKWNILCLLQLGILDRSGKWGRKVLPCPLSLCCWLRSLTPDTCKLRGRGSRSLKLFSSHRGDCGIQLDGQWVREMLAAHWFYRPLSPPSPFPDPVFPPSLSIRLYLLTQTDIKYSFYFSMTFLSSLCLPRWIQCLNPPCFSCFDLLAFKLR